MPIKIVCEKRHDKGLDDIWYPAFFCDVCGGRISDAANGNFYWKPNFDCDREAFYEKQLDAMFAHIGCDGAVEAADGWWWSPLEMFPLYLGKNAAMSIEAKDVKRYGLREMMAKGR